MYRLDSSKLLSALEDLGRYERMAFDIARVSYSLDMSEMPLGIHPVLAGPGSSNAIVLVTDNEAGSSEIFWMPEQLRALMRAILCHYSPQARRFPVDALGLRHF